MKHLITAAFILLSFNLSAQEQSSPEEVFNYFKDGLVFEHAETNFVAKVSFRIQSRFTYESEESEKYSPDLLNFEVRRTRVKLEGTILDPRLLYKFQFSFTRGDFDYDRTDYPNILRDAAVGWKFSEATTLWYGQTKLPGNRQRVISSGSQQFVDRSLLNSTFNIDRDLGVQLYHRIGSSRPLWLKLALSNGEGRATNNTDNGLAYTARIEWLPLGPFRDGGDYFEGDLARETEPKISLGAVYSTNKKTTRPGGQLGRQYETEDLNRDVDTYFADLLFKYQGFSWSSEYARRWANGPVFNDGAETVAIYKGQGVNTQVGYLFENNIEAALRYTKLWAEKEALPGVNDQNQYTVALSKYINEHKIKVQSDLSYSEDLNRLNNLYEGQWIFRMQLELGI